MQGVRLGIPKTPKNKQTNKNTYKNKAKITVIEDENIVNEISNSPFSPVEISFKQYECPCNDTEETSKNFVCSRPCKQQLNGQISP